MMFHRDDPLQARQPKQLFNGRLHIFNAQRAAPLLQDAQPSQQHADPGGIHKSQVAQIQAQVPHARIFQNFIQLAANLGGGAVIQLPSQHHGDAAVHFLDILHENEPPWFLSCVGFV